MCGIVGFTGNNEAAPILLDGLSKLEYRGYDSAGIAVRNGDAEPEIVKAKGKLKVLKEMTNDGKAVKGACGIGHTRWATHGEPSTVNAHPHCSDDENVIAVHNGIIENYQELKEKLGLTYFFISHNLNVVYQVSDRVGVMYLGNFVEVGEKEKIYSNPMHPYTQALLSAVPVPDPTAKRERILLEGSIPSAHKPPTGCKFHTRCPKCMECCKTQAPERYEVDDGHYVYCHLYDKERREQQK